MRPKCAAAASKRYYREHPEQRLLDDARRRARKRNLPCDIVRDDIVLPERCPILDIPIVVGEGCHSDNSPSLDRIDNQVGYTKENVRVISRRANRIKSDASLAELIELVLYVARHQADIGS
jgi:hypothetical protein